MSFHFFCFLFNRNWHKYINTWTIHYDHYGSIHNVIKFISNNSLQSSVTDYTSKVFKQSHPHALSFTCSLWSLDGSIEQYTRQRCATEILLSHYNRINKDTSVCSDTGSQTAQAGLKLTVQLRIIFNYKFSCLHLPSAKITCYHILKLLKTQFLKNIYLFYSLFYMH